jgi:hypothetical protein
MMSPVMTPAEKQERIDTLRLINTLGLKAGFDKEFCDMLDAALLFAEDVQSEQPQ